MRNDFKRKLLFFLLEHPNSGRTKYDIAKNAVGCHPTWGVKIFRELEQTGISQGTNVIDYERLVQLYGKYFKQFKSVHAYAPNPEALLKLAEKEKLDFAVTTYWAEKQITKFLFPAKLELYINNRDLEKWIKLLPKVSGAVGKGNIRFFLANQDFLDNHSEKMKGYRHGKIVKLPQLAIDLENEGGVAIQASEMIIEKIRNG